MKEKADTHLDEQGWLDLAADACDHAGVAYEWIEPITTWHQKFDDFDAYRNNAVFRLNGQRCVKLYGPESSQQFHKERATLQIFADHPGLPAPQFIAAAARSNQPPYLIMTEIAGETLQQSWDMMSRAELRAVAREIGTITAAYLLLPHDRLATIEQQFDTRTTQIRQMQAERKAEIEGMAQFTDQQRAELLHFLYGEALDYLNVPPKLTHSDLSHAHIFVTQQSGGWHVSGVIDWAEAMLGPAEWDTGFHWFWTFSKDQDTMRECLNTLYAEGGPPDHLARRCFGTHMYTYSMNEVWSYLNTTLTPEDSVVQQLTAFFFPSDVFGPPD